MSRTESEFTLLTTCADAAEASVLRSVLDANGIACVVQGEQHSGMLGPALGGAIIEVRLLVATRDVERARKLLAAEGRTAEGGTAGADVEEDVCPVHGEPSTGTCGQCGAILCARCPAVCEDCSARPATDEVVRRGARRKRAAWFALALFFGGPFVLALILLLVTKLVELLRG